MATQEQVWNLSVQLAIVQTGHSNYQETIEKIGSHMELLLKKMTELAASSLGGRRDRESSGKGLGAATAGVATRSTLRMRI